MFSVQNDWRFSILFGYCFGIAGRVAVSGTATGSSGSARGRSGRIVGKATGGGGSTTGSGRVSLRSAEAGQGFIQENCLGGGEMSVVQSTTQWCEAPPPRGVWGKF